MDIPALLRPFSRLKANKVAIMKIITQTFILFIAVLILPLVLFGQAKSITSENYYSALKEAESKTEKQVRKVSQIQKLYRNGELTATLTDTTEYLPPDKSSWIHIENRGGAISKRIEQIRIGSIRYRKEDNGEWIKREGEGSYGFGGISGTDDSTREYFVEEATIGKEKFRVLIEKRINGMKTFFDESKIWINNKGLISKISSTTSFAEPGNIVSAVDVTYDYKLKPPKIAAPVK